MHVPNMHRMLNSHPFANLRLFYSHRLMPILSFILFPARSAARCTPRPRAARASSVPCPWSAPLWAPAPSVCPSAASKVRIRSPLDIRMLSWECWDAGSVVGAASPLIPPGPCRLPRASGPVGVGLVPWLDAFRIWLCSVARIVLCIVLASFDSSSEASHC